MPSINALHETLKGQGLTVLLVNLGEGREVVRRAVAAHGYTAPVVLDVDGRVAAAYRVTGTPTVYLLGRGLAIVGRAVGRRDWASEDGRRLFAALLSTPAGRRPAPRPQPRSMSEKTVRRGSGSGSRSCRRIRVDVHRSRRRAVGR